MKNVTIITTTYLSFDRLTCCLLLLLSKNKIEISLNGKTIRGGERGTILDRTRFYFIKSELHCSRFAALRNSSILLRKISSIKH